MGKRTYLRTLSSAFAIASTLCFAAGAQAAESDTAGGDIIVTAAKTGAQSIQKVPLNISAVGEDALEKASATTLDDVMRQVPGVNVSGGTGNKTVVIRGLAAQTGAAQVGIYLDEALLPAQGNASVAQGTPELFDIARVEVLRGPQGTLYGAGAQSGTVRYITNEPDLQQMKGAFSTEAGVRSSNGGGKYQVNAMANLPVVEDVLGLRVAGFARHTDGFVSIPSLNRDHSDKEDTIGARAQMLFKPAPDTKITASLNYQKIDMADMSRVLATQNIRTNPVLEPFVDKMLIASAVAEQGIGFGTVTATYSHIDRRNSYNFDQSQFLPAPNRDTYLPDQFDSYDLNYGVMQQEGHMRSDVGELRFASDFNFPLQVTGGLFYNKMRMVADVFGSYVDPTTGLPYAQLPTWYQTHATSRTTNKAAFVNGNLEITDSLKLEAGIRFFKLGRTTRTYVANSYFDDTVGWGDPSGAKSNGNVKKAQLTYNVTDDIMTYVVFSEGFREGGANTVFPGASYPADYTPDFVKNYEFGFKTQLFDRQLTLNGALYHMQWTDIQVQQRDVTGAYTYTSNAGKANLDGVELEATIRPAAIPGFTLGLNGRYSVQKLAEDNPLVTGLNPNPYAGMKGQAIPYSNKLGGAVSVDQDFDVGTLPAYIHADATYTGKGYTAFDPSDPYRRRIGDYAIVNARIGVTGAGWTASLYGKNLTNVRGITTWRVEALAGLADRVFIVDRREIGAAVSFEF
ncbi:MAG: TonB-dependent receptor [Novosphingobium sp.]